MELRTLGTTGLRVAPVMLGGNVFGWTVDEAASFTLLDRAFDLGLRFWDTADVYSRWVPGNQGGESEMILGKWFARTGKRNDVVLVTKVGMDMGEAKGLSPRWIQTAAERSLQRLRTDVIDVYLSHQDDPAVPLEDTLGAYSRLIEQGKVRHVGASNYTGARLREALDLARGHGLPKYEVLEPHYNLLERNPYETDLAPVVAEYKLGVIPYSALASGFLTGKYRSQADLEGKARSRGAAKYLNERGLGVLSALDEVAGERDANPAQVAIAWLAAQPGITAPIASATSETQLQDLAAAAQIRLTPDELRRLDSAGG